MKKHTTAHLGVSYNELRPQKKTKNQPKNKTNFFAKISTLLSTFEAENGKNLSTSEAENGGNLTTPRLSSKKGALIKKYV